MRPTPAACRARQLCRLAGLPPDKWMTRQMPLLSQRGAERTLPKAGAGHADARKRSVKSLCGISAAPTQQRCALRQNQAVTEFRCGDAEALRLYFLRNRAAQSMPGRVGHVCRRNCLLVFPLETSAFLRRHFPAEHPARCFAWLPGDSVSQQEVGNARASCFIFPVFLLQNPGTNLMVLPPAGQFARRYIKVRFKARFSKFPFCQNRCRGSRTPRAHSGGSCKKAVFGGGDTALRR